MNTTLPFIKIIIDGSGEVIGLRCQESMSMPQSFAKIIPAREGVTTPVDLLDRQDLSPEMVAYLWFAMELKLSTIVCGPRDTMKVDILDAMSFFIPQDAQVASVSVRHRWAAPFGVWQDAKTREGEDIRPYLADSIMKQADYVFLERLEGPAICMTPLLIVEKKSLCAAVDVEDGFDEFVKMVTEPPIGMPKVQITAISIAAKIENISKVALNKDSAPIVPEPARKMSLITELVGYNTIEDKLIVNEPYWWEMRGKEIVRRPYGWFFFTGHSFLYDNVMESKGWTPKQVDEEILRRVDFLRWLFFTKKKCAEDVAREIGEYLKSPEAMAQRCRKELKDVSLAVDGKRDDGTPLPRTKARLRAL